MKRYDQNTRTIFAQCPHCNAYIEVRPGELNCAIFRHGVYKDTLDPIHPHASRDSCEFLLKNGLIYGCGKPFRIIQDSSGTVSCITCDYI